MLAMPTRWRGSTPARRRAHAWEARRARLCGDRRGQPATLPLGEIYPVAPGAPEAPFAHRLSGPPRYPLGDGAEHLLPLSIRNLARRGSASSYAITADGLRARLLDSARATTVWHRLYAEASIPPVRASSSGSPPPTKREPPGPAATTAWHPHGFGRDIAALARDALGPHVPRAAWERVPSELPTIRGWRRGRPSATGAACFRF